MKHIDDDILEQYLHNECEQVEEVEAHLATCPQCRAALDELQVFHSTLADEYAVEPSTPFVDAVMQRIASAEAAPAATSKPGFFELLREWGLQSTAIAWSLLIIWMYSVATPVDVTYLLENAEVNELESEIFVLNPQSQLIQEEYL